jgi:hypothetical protein
MNSNQIRCTLVVGIFVKLEQIKKLYRNHGNYIEGIIFFLKHVNGRER